MSTFKKILALAMAACLLVSTAGMAFASDTQNESTQPPQGEGTTPPEKPDGDDGQQPPEMPNGENGQQPPEMPDGENGQQPPEMPDGENGQQPPEMPDGEMPGGMGGDMGGDMGGGMPGGMGGGMSGAPESYTAVRTLDADTAIDSETIESTGTDENALLVTGGASTVTSSAITRTSSDSTGGDNASFYGVGAAVLVTAGSLEISDTTIDTDAAGGAGAFAYADGTITLNNCTITTAKDTSGGIHVAGGGTLVANNCTATTEGNSSAAIRSDRGGGTMTVNGGSYTSDGVGSPAVYVTADITINDATLAATASEALCLEGKNSVSFTNTTLAGNMSDDAQNDNTWTVIVYQSMSGDSEVGEGSFTMDGGELISQNGGLFYTTNTDSVFSIRNVAITACEDSEYFLRCTGNQNQRGWGSTGANGADCTFTAAEQDMNGNVIWDSVSNLDLTLSEGTVFTGAVLDDESCAGEGGDGTCTLTVDATSCWIVTGDSTLTTLNNAGSITDAEGKTVTIVGTDGTVYVTGDSTCTVTVSEYNA